MYSKSAKINPSFEIRVTDYCHYRFVEFGPEKSLSFFGLEFFFENVEKKPEIEFLKSTCTS